MFFAFSDYTTLLSLIYNRFICVFSYYYLCILWGLLLLFVSYRFPYAYSPFFFVMALGCYLLSGFISMFLMRLFESPNNFFSSFVPIGTPIYICPLVCCAETVSYIIRPFVLIFRPFINISLGCFGAVAVGNFCLFGGLWVVVLFIIFFYEVFVALVHWFIVTSILDFSIDH
uniref:ATP synthase F0 subunit 6 n=1 Tax=Bothridium pithonis TaxID=1648426 RepID=A0A8F7GND3_9CEST|nr:ATP synthase F0 subunit 6 [Bothridium pithonis]